MMNNTLLIDVPNLAWRAFHTTGHLRNDIGPTGVTYGVMRTYNPS